MPIAQRSVEERRLLTQQWSSLLTSADVRPVSDIRRQTRLRATAHMAIVAVLLCLAAANLRARWTWSEVEDGVLWTMTANDVTAKEIAEGSPAQRHDVR